MPEWPKGHDWKSCVPKGTEGSNPSLSSAAADSGNIAPAVTMSGKRIALVGALLTVCAWPLQGCDGGGTGGAAGANGGGGAGGGGASGRGGTTGGGGASGGGANGGGGASGGGASGRGGTTGGGGASGGGSAGRGGTSGSAGTGGSAGTSGSSGTSGSAGTSGRGGAGVGGAAGGAVWTCGPTPRGCSCATNNTGPGPDPSCQGTYSCCYVGNGFGTTQICNCADDTPEDCASILTILQATRVATCPPP